MLVVIAIGWPLSEAQQRGVDAGRVLARAASVVFDAHLVASPHDAAALIGSSDEVAIDASPRERRRIRRALGTLSVRVAR